MKKVSLGILLALLTAACMRPVEFTTEKVWLTAPTGEKMQEQAPITFTPITNYSQGLTITGKWQVFEGIGVSLTESSAFVLACLPKEQREAVLKEFFSEEGANFPLVRTHIGACDFSVEGKYSLAEVPGDTLLTSFSLQRDKEGFSPSVYPQVLDSMYDLYHLMRDVAAIKASQADSTYKILASAWTAPAWMKDNNAYYERGNGVARGGKLLPQYYATYANYLVKYIQAYQQEGINIWAVTPVNEPMGNDGGWESMDVSPQDEAKFIGHYLAPAIKQAGLSTKIFGFDQNTFEMGPYISAIYGDSLARAATAGMAVHWYGSTVSSFPDVLDSVYANHLDKLIIHTEGCVDNLGCPAWDAVTDPEGFTEENWFANDAFWWNKEATDWAYSTPFWPELHPKYSVVERYVTYLLEGIEHRMHGFIDWNMVLDKQGGPNHVSNFCGAPLMVDTDSKQLYYTPYYYALKQISNTLRPGDTIYTVSGKENTPLYGIASVNPQGKLAVQLYNHSDQPYTTSLTIGKWQASITIPAKALLTLVTPNEIGFLMY
ncbi:MAG: hypothetical protein IIX52_04055 [Paludibacteraceae bacterium]|nr:hypothetical protein [Paludibacteraceae bacterium]